MSREIKLIERDAREGAYGMTQTVAIVEHPEHGRLLLMDVYGGAGELRGGMYRWGVAIGVQPGDTIASLLDGDVEARGRMLAGQDDARPVMEWDGATVESIAKSAGL